MAPKRKTKKTSNTHKKKIDAERKKSVKESGAIQDEIILVIALVISILLFLSNIRLCGSVGEFISSFVFGLVGAVAYIIPFVIFFIIAFYISNIGNKRAGRKIISALVFFAALAALLQMITDPSKDINILDYYLASSKGRNGGGIIGGILAKLLCSLFDKVATYIILIAIMIISIIVITGKAIFTYIASKSKSSLEERMEYQRIRKEERDAIASEMKSNELERRPPKTFVINKTTPATLKHRGMKIRIVKMKR
jgi:S-DNA-T family DNA segregation ATPase FtsK/SpoIIIE